VHFRTRRIHTATFGQQALEPLGRVRFGLLQSQNKYLLFGQGPTFRMQGLPLGLTFRDYATEKIVGRAFSLAGMSAGDNEGRQSFDVVFPDPDFEIPASGDEHRPQQARQNNLDADANCRRTGHYELMCQGRKISERDCRLNLDGFPEWDQDALDKLPANDIEIVFILQFLLVAHIALIGFHQATEIIRGILPLGHLVMILGCGRRCAVPVLWRILVHGYSF
jgi:hypothetical protein